jgi:hypothetical protein
VLAGVVKWHPRPNLCRVPEPRIGEPRIGEELQRKSGGAADGWGRLSPTLASVMAQARRYPGMAGRSRGAVMAGTVLTP